MAALEIAQARDFVAAMPGGLDAPIDQGGTNVSGGQRQRLSIARALVKRPRLYLFDDCFSALDAATDARLRAALRAETARRRRRDRRAAGQHDHARRPDHRPRRGARRRDRHATRELLAGCEAYREIVASQLGEEAAAHDARRPGAAGIGRGPMAMPPGERSKDVRGDAAAAASRACDRSGRGSCSRS